MTDIFFLALRGYATLTGSPAVQFSLNIRLGECDPWRAAIDHHTYCTTVRFAPGRNTKQMPKGVAHTRRPSLQRLFYGSSGGAYAVVQGVSSAGADAQGIALAALLMLLVRQQAAPEAETRAHIIAAQEIGGIHMK